jgi:RNA polymerase sigma factor FliA
MIWGAYWNTRGTDERNALVIEYRSLVRRVVQRLPGRVRALAEQADLESYGVLGLIEAVERCDEESELARFPGYAAHRIRGAIFDELRHQDWLPRSVRQRSTTFRALSDEMSVELGRVPDAGEVVVEMGLRPEQAHGVVAEMHRAHLLNFQNEDTEGHLTSPAPVIEHLLADERQEPAMALLASEQLGELREALAKLPERQREVLQRRFVDNMSQVEIGAELGVTNSRICQIETAALRALRELIEHPAATPRRRRRSTRPVAVSHELPERLAS